MPFTRNHNQCWVQNAMRIQLEKREEIIEIKKYKNWSDLKYRPEKMMHIETDIYTDADSFKL